MLKKKNKWKTDKFMFILWNALQFPSLFMDLSRTIIYEKDSFIFFFFSTNYNKFVISYLVLTPESPYCWSPSDLYNLLPPQFFVRYFHPLLCSQRQYHFILWWRFNFLAWRTYFQSIVFDELPLLFVK